MEHNKFDEFVEIFFFGLNNKATTLTSKLTGEKFDVAYAIDTAPNGSVTIRYYTEGLHDTLLLAEYYSTFSMKVSRTPAYPDKLFMSVVENLDPEEVVM